MPVSCKKMFEKVSFFPPYRPYPRGIHFGRKYKKCSSLKNHRRIIFDKLNTITLNKCNLLMKELLISVYLIKSPYLCVLKILIYSEVLLHFKCMNHFTGICVHILYSVIIAFFASYFFTFIITKDSSA